MHKFVAIINNNHGHYIFQSLYLSSSLVTILTPFVLSCSVCFFQSCFDFVLVCFVLILFVAFLCTCTVSDPLRECHRAGSLKATLQYITTPHAYAF